MKLSTRMNVFLSLIALHWIEHICQAYQVYVMGMHRQCAFGFLGMKWPWLVQSESLHFAFALFTFFGMLIVAQNYFMSYDATRFWGFGWLWSMWHLFEHTLLFIQATIHHNFFGRLVPTSIIQLIFPRIELHLFYNTIITFYIVRALLLERKFNREHKWPNCFNGRQLRENSVVQGTSGGPGDSQDPQDALLALEHGAPYEVIFLDFAAGWRHMKPITFLPVAERLAELNYSGTVIIHSMDPQGVKQMEQLLEKTANVHLVPFGSFELERV